MGLVLLLGHPVAHSLSPAMHNAAFAALGLPHRYEVLDLEASGLPAVIERLRRGELLGANVTVPHKEAARALVDTWDAPTAEVGAVNTLSRTADGRVLGSNTDVVGFAYLVRDLPLADARVLVLGAGGAARAALPVLYERGARVRLTNRTAARAERLAREIAHPVGRDPEVVPWPERLDLAAVDVVVNTTALGLAGEDPLAGADLPATLIVVDLVPTAAPTPLLRRARASGARAVDGLPMLLQQALSSFRIWTGRDAPVEVMRSALFGRAS